MNVQPLTKDTDFGRPHLRLLETPPDIEAGHAVYQLVHVVAELDYVMNHPELRAELSEHDTALIEEAAERLVGMVAELDNA